MKKTKIEFKDIKAGDMLEIVSTEYGVKAVITGIAFEKVGTKGNEDWQTSQGGLIAAGFSDEDIFRIDVTEVKFEDIRKGDRVLVTEKIGKMVTTVENTVVLKIDGGFNPYWLDETGEVVLFRLSTPNAKRTIEILERAE